MEPGRVAAATEEETEWPIWRALQEILKDVPEEAFDELPRDGAAQHDHYIHGTPKRPQ